MKISETIKVAVDNNMPCLLVGNHGTGKSYGIRQAADKADKKLSRIIITQETTPEDLIFNYELKDGETKKTKRELLKAVEKGEWIVLEEINMASPAVLTMLNGLLETDPESRYLRYLNKEVKPHKDFRLFATSNPTSYSGANRMNDALLSRFLINKVNPDYKFFLGIIRKEYKDEELSKECKQFVSAITKIKKNYEIYISPRELLVYAKLRNQDYSPEEALGFVLDRFYDEDAEILEDISALFEVERDRDEIMVLNSIELRKKIDDETQEIRLELEEKKEKLKQLQKYQKLMEGIKEQLN
jgi:MoxR-like ATPase